MTGTRWHITYEARNGARYTGYVYAADRNAALAAARSTGVGRPISAVRVAVPAEVTNQMTLGL